jgi:hypothetical protein
VIAAAGHGWGTAIFPLVAAVIAFAFAWSLGRQWLGRRRLYQALWSISLAMFGVASLAMVLGVVDGWSAVEFRLYWLFGAVLNVPYLAAGEIALLDRRRLVARGFLLVVAAASVVAAWEVATAALRSAPLGRLLPLGKDAFVDHGLFGPYHLAQWCGNGAYGLLLLGILWSVWQMRGRPELRPRVAGTLLIAAGASVVAVGSGIGAAFDIVWLFAVGLAAGVAVMFYGFVRVGRPARTPARSAG